MVCKRKRWYTPRQRRAYFATEGFKRKPQKRWRKIKSRK